MQQDATAAAARQYKFLLVYLHAAGHDDTPKFCRETLSANEVGHRHARQLCSAPAIGRYLVHVLDSHGGITCVSIITLLMHRW